MAKGRRGNGEGSIVQRWQARVPTGVDPKTGKLIMQTICAKTKEELLKKIKGEDVRITQTWMASATVGRNPNGTLKRKCFYGKTRQEVAEKLNQTINEVRTKVYVEPSKMLVGEWLDKWLNDYMKPSLRITTWNSYRIQIDKHLKPAIGTLKLTELQTGHLQKLYNEKLKGGRADKRKGGLSPRSVRYIHVVILSALEQAVKERFISINPAKAVKLPKEERKEMKTLDSEGMKKFLKEARNSKYYVAYLLELTTGLRRGELLGLKWKNVNLNTCTITVKEQLIQTVEGKKFSEPKTKSSKRTIGIPETVVKELKAYKAAQNKQIIALGEAYEKNDLVFCNELGQPLDIRSFTRYFERLLERAGLEHMRFHDLRHSYATLCLQEGVSIKTVSEMLGHTKSSFTMDVYSHVTDKMKQEATQKIGDLLDTCLSR